MAIKGMEELDKEEDKDEERWKTSTRRRRWKSSTRRTRRKATKGEEVVGKEDDTHKEGKDEDEEDNNNKHQ